MAFQVPNTEPDSLTAGDTAQWTKTLSDFPATDGWTLTYYIVQPNGSNAQSFTATASGRDYSISVSASITGAWVAGKYSAEAKVSKSGEVHTVWRGSLTISASIASNSGDIRSHARIVLDNVRAVIEKRATREILNSEVAGVKLERMSYDQLKAIRDDYEVRVRNEEIALLQAQGKPTGRTIRPRFPFPQ